MTNQELFEQYNTEKWVIEQNKSNLSKNWKHSLLNSCIIELSSDMVS